jgi:hypothetical protein
MLSRWASDAPIPSTTPSPAPTHQLARASLGGALASAAGAAASGVVQEAGAAAQGAIAGAGAAARSAAASGLGALGGDGSGGGGGGGDATYDELLRRLRDEQEQLGQLIQHPF